MPAFALVMLAAIPRPAGAEPPDEPLAFPGLLERDALIAGNPLATYAAMVDLEERYLQSPVFARIYPEVKCNFEQFMGDPTAGVRAMSLPAYRRAHGGVAATLPPTLTNESALSVVIREARRTRLVIWAEEHHLPQTRSLYEPMLRALREQGYRYLAAETFGERVMAPGSEYPDYESGYYLRDPVFASAVRAALDLGYELIVYDTTERGPEDDASFRDRTQAERIKARIFDRDPEAKAIVLAGRAHASERPGADGWTPMASVLTSLTGIDPFTVYAPTMSARLTREEEHPLYRAAVSRELVAEPTILVDEATGAPFGPDFCDAYVFWPREGLIGGRPDWLVNTLGRRAVEIPGDVLEGQGLRLIQAWGDGMPAAAVPVDQVVIDDEHPAPVLMLPPGHYRLRSIDRESQVIARAALTVR